MIKVMIVPVLEQSSQAEPSRIWQPGRRGKAILWRKDLQLAMYQPRKLHEFDVDFYVAICGFHTALANVYLHNDALYIATREQYLQSLLWPGQ